MSHTYAQNTVHVIFSTKNRRKIIPKDLQPKMWAYMAGICRKLDVFVLEIGGMEDHVHLLIQIPPKVALAKVVATIKANSSRWANEQKHKFSWQEGYGAFSVSASIGPDVIRYIHNQETHHQKMGFDEEFMAILKKHAVAFDPKFALG